MAACGAHYCPIARVSIQFRVQYQSHLRAKWSTHQMWDQNRKTMVCGYPTYNSGCWTHLEIELELFIMILLWIWNEPAPKDAGFSVTGAQISQNSLEQLPRAFCPSMPHRRPKPQCPSGLGLGPLSSFWIHCVLAKEIYSLRTEEEVQVYKNSPQC